MRHCVPEEDEAESHWTLAWQKEQPAPLSFLLTLLSSFTFWKSTGKISWNYNLPSFSIQFPIFLFDALSHFSLFQSCEVELRSGWPIQEYFILSKTVPLTPHQKNGHSKNQFPQRPMSINHGVNPVSHPRCCSQHTHTVYTFCLTSAELKVHLKHIAQTARVRQTHISVWESALTIHFQQESRFTSFDLVAEMDWKNLLCRAYRNNICPQK